MKILKKALKIILRVNLIWVLLLFVSFPVSIKNVTLDDLPKILINKWEDLKNKNLIHGTIVIKKGKEVIYADGDANKPYKIASISKSFTGYIYYLKAKKGDINLDSPACNWLKSLCKGRLNSITLNHLLNHTSGFSRDLNFPFFLKRDFSGEWNRSQLDDLNISEKDLNFAPGTDFTYSNFGYILLSRILEKIENKSFDKILLEMAVQNQLKSTSLIKGKDLFTNFLLIPFIGQLKFPITSDSSLSRVAGAGGIISSTTDLIKWLEILNESFLEETFNGKDKTNYLKGFIASKNQDYKSYWHNGSVPGSYSLIAIVPKSDLKIVILTDNFKLIKQWSENSEIFEKYFY